MIRINIVPIVMITLFIGVFGEIGYIVARQANEMNKESELVKKRNNRMS